MVKQAEKELGSFDCVHVEPGKSTPSVGKLSVYKTSLVFKARMFGLDDTTISVKRRDLDSVDATSPLTLKMTYKETKSLDLQFTKSTIPYRCVVDNWRLCETERDAFAVNERAANKKEAREYPAGVSGAARRVKEYVEESYETLNKALKSALQDAGRLGARIPPTPRLPAIDCEEAVSRCIFVSVRGAQNLLAMDGGGTSDPFVVVRYRGLEATSSTKSQTLNPTWDETFHFLTPPGKQTLDDDDEVEFIVYDRDYGGLNDFIGYAKLDLNGTAVHTATDSAVVRADPDVWGAGKEKRRREWLELGHMPKERTSDFFDLNHVKEKLMFWEGERPIQGRIEIQTWIGNRHDDEFRVAGVPALKVPDLDAERRVAHYVEPVTALLRVEVRRGRSIMDLDGDGGSDPYCEVALVDRKGIRPEQTQSTHYIDDATDPEWERTFNFIVAKPYEDDLVLRVYDYDGATAFDDLIGTVKIGLHELGVARGLNAAPEEQWLALLDKDGKDKNERGEAYGDVLVRAYLDEEYFEHLHGGDAKNEVGRLSVDVMGVKGLDAPKTTFAVVKIGPYWTRLPNVENSSTPRWDQRLRYPVFEPAARVTVAVFEGTAANCVFLGRVKLQLSTMEDGVRYGGEFQLMTKGADGVVTKTCALECGLQFDYHKGGSLVAAKYMEPLLPEKWYFAPLKDEEKDKVIKAQKEMMVQRLAQSSPPLAPLASKELLEFAKHEVNIGSIKSSIARIQRLVAGLDKFTSFAAYALSWDSIPLTACAQAWIVYLVYYPNMFAPTALLAVAVYSLCLFPGRYQRVLDRMVADEWLSQGLPFAPATEEEERARKEKEEEAKRLEMEAEQRRREEEKALGEAEEETAAAKKEQERILAERKKAAEKAAAERAAAEKPKEAFNWDSINPLAALQRQMDEVFAMITLSQTILDEVAGAAERLAGILSWEEPRVTAGFVVLLLALAWSLIYVEMVTRFFVKVILGVVLKTVFTVVSPSAIKFGVSAAILFVMRHPAILPDEKTKAVQEAKARAAREAALAKELAEAEGDADDEKAAPPPAPAPPSKPLPPLNVFFRMPTQSDRLL